MFVLLVGRPACAGIMFFCGFREVVALVVDNRSGMFYAGLLVTIHLVLCSLVCRQACDARHHGWYVLARCCPVVRSDRCHGLCRCEHAATSSSSPFLTGKCLIFCSPSTWWFSSLSTETGTQKWATQTVETPWRRFLSPCLA